MNDQSEDINGASDPSSISLERVMVDLFESMAVTQAQNDVLLGLLTSLVASNQDIEFEEVVDEAQERFQQHYQRRITELQSEHPFFTGDDLSDRSDDSDEDEPEA